MGFGDVHAGQSTGKTVQVTGAQSSASGIPSSAATTATTTTMACKTFQNPSNKEYALNHSWGILPSPLTLDPRPYLRYTPELKDIGRPGFYHHRGNYLWKATTVAGDGHEKCLGFRGLGV